MLADHVILSIIYIIVSSASLPLRPYPRSLVEMYKNKLGSKLSTTTTELPHGFTSEKVPSYFSRSYRALWKDLKGRRSDPVIKTEIKRGVDIGIHVKIPSTPKYNDNLEKLENMLEKALEGRRLEALDATRCPSCDEEEVGIVPSKLSVKPAFKCDEWDAKFRICILERNIGDTVTFYLSTGRPKRHKPKVTWRKEFHIQDSNTRKEHIIEPENSPENIIIGRKGYELRISPITEIDVGFNMFTATLEEYTSSHSKVSFMIRIVPNDLGFVYVGETIELNIRSYVSLPAESLSFKWYMEKDGEHGTLPSNMRISASGSSIKISELRQEQEGILACSVYTNLAFLATKKRFLMKDLVTNNDVLKYTPNHDLRFEEEPVRGRRDPKKLKRVKREIKIDDMIEKALMQPSTTEKYLVRAHEKTAISGDDYDLGKDIGPEEPKDKAYKNSHNREPQIAKYGYDSFDNSPFDTVESQEMSYDDSGSQGINAESQISSVSHSNKVETESSKIFHSQLAGGKATHGKNQQAGNDENMDTSSTQKNTFDKNEQYADENMDTSLTQKNTFDKNEQYADENMDTSLTQKNAFDKNEQYAEKNIKNGKNNYASHNEESEIILNIDKIPGPRRISAEEKIAKLVSSCYSDIECSGNAICVRSNLKYPGFCKCLPGFYGIGIFCREDISISKSSFGLDDMHNNNILRYSSPPFSEDNN